MEPQRVVPDRRIQADLGLVALKYGPLVYNVETADNSKIEQKLSNAPLKMDWRPDLLGGVMVISGKWADGSPLLAIPNYARMNRVGPPHEYPRDEEATVVAAPAVGTGPDSARQIDPPIESKIWI
jgi:hypothetical protein